MVDSADKAQGKGGKLIERVTALVALAASSSQEEARNAAYQACALIRDNRLRVCLPLADGEESTEVIDPGDIRGRVDSDGRPQVCVVCDQAFKATAFRIPAPGGQWMHLTCAASAVEKVATVLAPLKKKKGK